MTLKHFGQRKQVYTAVYDVADYPIQEGTLTRTALQGGHATRGHEHPWPEIYFVESGSGVLETRDSGVETVRTQALGPGSVVEVPPDVFHRVLAANADGIVFWGVFLGKRAEVAKK